MKVLFAIFLSLFFSANQALPCEKLELVFVIDESQSVGPVSFDKVKSFMEHMGTYLNQGSRGLINQKGIRVAVVGFGTSAAVEFGLQDIDDLASLMARIKKLQWMNGLTNLGDALSTVNSVFVVPNPWRHIIRPGVPNALILVSDGNWNIGADPVPIAEKLRSTYKSKILCLAISDNEQPDLAVLKKISGRSDFVFNATYDKLDTFIQKLTVDACSK